MIKLLVLDVDGCLSDGKICYTSSGEEFKHFNVKDGLIMDSWVRLGGKIAIITGRNSSIVERRAKELKVEHLFQGIKNKKEVLEGILKLEGLGWENVAALGDDLNDFGMLSSVGWSFCPNNASTHIQHLVKTVLSKDGGDGAVREMVELIFEKQNQTEEFLALWQ